MSDDVREHKIEPAADKDDLFVVTVVEHATTPAIHKLEQKRQALRKRSGLHYLRVELSHHCTQRVVISGSLCCLELCD